MNILELAEAEIDRRDKAGVAWDYPDSFAAYREGTQHRLKIAQPPFAAGALITVAYISYGAAWIWPVEDLDMHPIDIRFLEPIRPPQPRITAWWRRFLWWRAA